MNTRLSLVLTAGLLMASAAGASAADLEDLTTEQVNGAKFEDGSSVPEGASALALKTQVLLDRADASPGVIDGYFGENVAKAISAYEKVHNLPDDGKLDAEVWKGLGGDAAEDALVDYEITEEDVNQDYAESIPEDYAKMAEMDRLAYTSPEEMLAERFHMDIDLLKALNPDADFSKAGTTISVAKVGEPLKDADVARIEADKSSRQVRVYNSEDKLLVAYPATIGSEENPSPSGTHEVQAIAIEPVYYYRPDENFQQGDNDKPLDIPPGPNNPVGMVWIDLSEPTYGIHGTPEPAEIDKTASHGCVRLTNWDAEELAGLVAPGVTVEFVE